MKKIIKKRFITFEGIDGSGKTTQIKLLKEHLERQGTSVTSTREPGGTKIGEEIRSLILSGKYGRLPVETEIMLFGADRVQHVKEIIKPALLKGDVVLCDRFTDSTIAYQGYRLYGDLNFINKLNELTAGGLTPGLTILLDIKANVALERCKNRGGKADVIESDEIANLNVVRAGYIEVALRNTSRAVIVDASKTIEEVFKDVVKAVDKVCF